MVCKNRNILSAGMELFNRPLKCSLCISSAKLIKLIFHYNRTEKHTAASWNRNAETKCWNALPWRVNFSLTDMHQIIKKRRKKSWRCTHLRFMIVHTCWWVRQQKSELQVYFYSEQQLIHFFVCLILCFLTFKDSISIFKTWQKHDRWFTLENKMCELQRRFQILFSCTENVQNNNALMP